MRHTHLFPSLTHLFPSLIASFKRAHTQRENLFSHSFSRSLAGSIAASRWRALSFPVTVTVTVQGCPCGLCGVREASRARDGGEEGEGGPGVENTLETQAGAEGAHGTQGGSELSIWSHRHHLRQVIIEAFAEVVEGSTG